MPKERRKYTRLKAHHLVKYTLAGKEGQGETLSFVRNIGGGGILFYSQEEIPAGSTIDLEINFPGRSQPIKVFSKVVRARTFRKVEGYEIAVRFIEISPDDQEFINRKIQDASKRVEKAAQRVIIAVAAGLGIIVLIYLILRLM